MAYWIAQPPIAEGLVGTGPVDLSLATQVISGPDGFDLPGGAGVIFDRAYWWFMDAASKSTSDADRRENYLVLQSRLWIVSSGSIVMSFRCLLMPSAPA